MVIKLVDLNFEPEMHEINFVKIKKTVQFPINDGFNEI